MTPPPTASVDGAPTQHDVTIALTPAQLLLLAIGVWMLLRILRGLRG